MSLRVGAAELRGCSGERWAVQPVSDQIRDGVESQRGLQGPKIKVGTRSKSEGKTLES